MSYDPEDARLEHAADSAASSDVNVLLWNAAQDSLDLLYRSIPQKVGTLFADQLRKEHRKEPSFDTSAN